MGDGNGPVLAMNGHLDVVPVSDIDRWKTDPFTGVFSEDGKKVYGRGSSDMKGSVGVMLHHADDEGARASGHAPGAHGL